ncbi:MAG: hypothetical protein QOC81_1023 [Thermoanaerobaculia bacterium]|jgi:hypothetical protein|nr:hypothetical protein [Thermoanaerobaculia bacterium]
MNSPKNHHAPTAGKPTLLAIIAILFLAAFGSAAVVGERPVSSPVYAPVTGLSSSPIAIASNGDRGRAAGAGAS